MIHNVGNQNQLSPSAPSRRNTYSQPQRQQWTRPEEKHLTFSFLSRNNNDDNNDDSERKEGKKQNETGEGRKEID